MAETAEVTATVSVSDVLIDSKSDSKEINNDPAKENGSKPVASSSSEGEFLAPAEEYWTTDADGAVKIRVGTTEHDNTTPITVYDLFKRTAEKAGDCVALAVKRNDQWQKWTYSQYMADIRTAAKGFIKLGLESFNGVSIIGFNSPEWLISDVAAIFARGLAVGIYTTNSPEACKYVIEDSNSSIVVVENKIQLDKILKIWDELPNLKAVIQYTGELEDKSKPNVYTWKDFMELGKSCDDTELDARIGSLKANQCCTLVYTSGTTGNPKGVMLSHDNVVYTSGVSVKFMNMEYKNECTISFLPLSHIAAQLMDIYMAQHCAGTLWFAKPDALKGSLGETLKEVRPTLVMAVPRVWEKIMEKLQTIGRSTTGMKKKISTWAKGVGLRGNMNLEQGASVPFGWTVANALVFKKVRAALGLDRCRHLATGAAPITMETLRYYQSLNIPLYELYGMSECSGPMTVGKARRNLTGACGAAVDGLQMKIHEPDQDGNGEICMLGRHVFMGYLNNEEKTKETMDSDGYLHSGDIGKIDKNGFLFITGRIKEIIITAGGENIAPVPIEDQLKVEVPIISNAMLIGDKRKFLSCLLTIKSEMNLETGEPLNDLTELARDYCKQHGVEIKTVSEFLEKNDEKIMKSIQDGIDRYNEKATSRAQKIQKWCILEHDFSVPGGELGPTMKMRRPIIAKMYASKIDAFYS
ncbi:long-chain-fatty-acid--CoA ligase ACSBG2-like [Dendronephthya gigantea]|uniref:long-chain-fatty-acid--CoA ligase ACSBG2-like n=1 Tax=Dendronephthya gigantea TaxID=151771 RepID=UPI00106B33AD|nr:long-chain-fatty-acid--CoA ligase ACSBG2-like [Dendronephthya gigantea]XP_028411293.1 long-chain-fatty-acid--CoA ligase ACSBG2-like [Dendronephthya gigantea]